MPPPGPRLAVWLLLGSAAAALAAPRPSGAEPVRLVVKLRAEGAAAISECAESLAAHGRSFQSAAADGSDSLDRLHRRLGVRRVRALYRRPDGRPFAEQRARLRQHLRAAAPPGAAGLPDLSHVYVLELPDGADPGRAAALYGGDPHVEWAQEDFRIEAAFVPDDPFFASSGSWGQSYADLWGLHAIGAAEAWDVTQGEGVVVAVVDTGLDYDHPDIAENVWVNPGEDLDGNGVVDASDFNGVDDDGNGLVDDLRGFDFEPSFDSEDESDPDPFDDNGHGSHVAGTVAAVADNGIGIAGVAPRARVLPQKVLNEFGSGSISVASRAIVYAAETGARVINNSWSCGGGCPSNPVVEEAVRVAHALGVVVVFAAGNRSGDMAWLSPQNMRETISVAATSERDRVLDFSNPGFLLDVAAPGGGEFRTGVPLPQQNVLSLRSSGRLGGEAQTVADEYFRLSGTSMSAPHVAGVAALLLAHRPDLDPEQVRAAIRGSALDLGPPGHDRETGAGRIDAVRALERAGGPDVRAEITEPAQRALLRPQAGTIPVRGTASGADFESYALFFGQGMDPEAWIAFGGGSLPVEDGELGAWRVEGLDDGAYVLRIEARARDGTRIEEFALASLERLAVRRISSPGASAFEPDVSGNLVVWGSRRRFSEEDGINLFATDLSDDREYVISAAPGDQRFARIAGDVVAWSDRRDAAGAFEIYACRLDRRNGRCPEVAVAVAPLHTSLPDATREGLAWADARTGVFDLFACVLRGRHCRAEPVAPHPSNQFNVRVDGQRFVWRDDRSGEPRLFTCERDPGSGACPEQELAPGSPLQLGFALSGPRVAWEQQENLNRADLAVCDLEAGAGTCDPIRIPTRDATPALSLSGSRLAWNSTRRGDDRDIFLCEFDPITRTCPVQRITGAAGAQQTPAIDGDWLVWEDLRSGRLEIFGIELPSLRGLRDRKVAEGKHLAIRVTGRDPQGAALALFAEQAGGGPVEALGARFTDSGDGRGTFEWTPGFDRVGDHFVTFTGTTDAQLSTRRTIRIRVVEADPRPAGPPHRGD